VSEQNNHNEDERDGFMRARNTYALCIGWLLALLCITAGAEDLYINGVLRDIKPGTLLRSDDTLGGYSLYPDDGKWRYFEARMADALGPDPLVLASADWVQVEGTDLFAYMRLTANLNQGGTTRSWSGTPCGPDHLVVINKGRGLEDHCMTIDPVSMNIANQQVTLLNLRATNTAGSGRYYVTELLVNPALMGHPETAVGDWSKEQIQANIGRSEFVERLTHWSHLFLDASIRAFDYSKPKDAFKEVPSMQSLFPAAALLKSLGFSQQFASAVHGLKYRPGFKALAYTNLGQGRTHWGTAWSKSTQTEAEQVALRSCEMNKPTSAASCQLYLIH